MIAYNAQSSYNQYRDNSIAHAKPEELTFMLYNGLVKFIMRAQDSVQGKRFEEAHVNMVKAQNIVQEFMNTLDHSYEISASMELIYDYLYRRLIDANAEKSPVILEEVLGFAKDLRDTWEQAMKLAKQPQPKAQATASAN